MKLEVKNKLGEIYYTAQFNEANGWIESHWYGYVTAEEVIEACKQLLAALKDVPYTLHLNNSSKGEGSWEEANEWLSQNWFPFAMSSGLKKFSYVVSADIFSAMSSEELTTIIPGNAFEMRTFRTQKEAENWLKEAC